jgi:hypothetical protein
MEDGYRDLDGGPHHPVFNVPSQFLSMGSKSSPILAKFAALSRSPDLLAHDSGGLRSRARVTVPGFRTDRIVASCRSARGSTPASFADSIPASGASPTIDHTTRFDRFRRNSSMKSTQHLLANVGVAGSRPSFARLAQSARREAARASEPGLVLQKTQAPSTG